MVFSELLEKFLQHFGNSVSRPSRVTTVSCQTVQNGRPGRPSVDIPPEVLEDLRGLGFTLEKIAKIFRVSRWTIMRRVRLFDLEHLSLFSTMTDEEIARHGSTTGETYLRRHFKAMGNTVQRRQIRESLNRVDPRNTALRWGALVSRRVYFVPWPNSLWHLDGHHSLIRWGVCNSRVYRWLLTNNNFPSLQHTPVQSKSKCYRTRWWTVAIPHYSRLWRGEHCSV